MVDSFGEGVDFVDHFGLDWQVDQSQGGDEGEPGAHNEITAGTRGVQE